MRTPSVVVKCATGSSPEGCGTRGFYGTVLRRGSQAARAGGGAGAAGRGHPGHHQGPAAGRRLLRGRLPGRAGLASARRPGRRQRIAAEADGRLSRRVGQRGGGGRLARRVHQLPDARCGDLEVDRGHQRGRGRALQPGLGGGDRGRAHRVGEDYGAGASVIQERTHAFALKSSLVLIDPQPTLQNLARMVEAGFGISEASNLPAVISLRIRAAHMRGSMVCRDNVRPAVSMNSPLERHSFDYGRLSHPPSTYIQEAQKFERRLPAAQRYIVERGLNEVRPGEEKGLGIILQGGLTPTALRALELLGAADAYGQSRIPMLVLNVIHPLVPDQLLAFLEGKQRVLVLEEGMPSFIEQELKALAYDHGITTRIHGKDVVAAQGEYVPEVVLGALARFLGGDAERRRQALTAHVGQGRAQLRTPLPKRPPAFCTGCPERPVFSALKIAQRELGETHVAADIGCHAFATLPPFNQGNTILGYGMSVASASAVAPH